MLQQETLRLFIAIEFSKKLKDAIYSLIEKLKISDVNSSIRWISYEDLHITLKFLGEVAKSKIPSLEESIKNAVSNKNTFELSLSGVGVFPNENRPGVFWVGVKDSEPLMSLAKSVIKECASMGFPEENWPFSPHITIGRARDKANPANLTKIMSLLTSLNVRKESQLIDHISLIWSQLTTKGPVYTTLNTASFG
ncbi:MAG: RNA 2',3'-cyclic phosphodiesterase [Dehalococcoidia bacterium]|nr:RNA 2',3'-cyclic phosphodiesterase [Dehalococcoidia bacterium]